MQVDNTLHQLELEVKLASLDLIEFTGRSGFLLEMPAGDAAPPHYVIVGTAAEISWLLNTHAAKRNPMEHAAGIGIDSRH